MNSDYETQINPSDTNRWYKLRANNLSSVSDNPQSSNYSGIEYLFNSTHVARQGKSLQWAIEGQTYPFYTDENWKNLLYNGQNWIQNLYLFGEYTFEARTKGSTGPWNEKFLFSPRVKGNSRPFTGEEARWALWRSILFGAKGLAFDGHITPVYGYIANDTAHGKNIVTNGITFDPTALGSGASDEDIVYKDDLWGGMDFVPEVDSATKFTHTPIDTVDSNGTKLLGYYHSLDRDTTAKYLGCKPTRIYYGRKSPKTEMYKMHSWIKSPAVELVLMDLRLVGTISKGIRFWQGWDPRFPSNPLNQIIKYDASHILYKFPDDTATDKTTIPSEFIKSRPYGRIYAVTMQPFYEPWDSTMFDLAIHRPVQDISLTGNTLYMALLSRRTNPQFLYTDPVDTAKKYLKFLSTAEFDELCIKGGKDPEFPGDSLPPEHWRSYFNKRLGNRELRIPFNFPTFGYSDGRYLRIRELGIESFDTLGSWYAAPYYHRIDTVMNIDGTLISNHLPGQGKMIRITKQSVFYPENEPEECNICDVINSSNFINIGMNPVSDIEGNCCYEIILHKEGGCAFDSIPVRFILKGGNGTFNGLGMTDSSLISRRFYNSTLTAAVNDYYSLGTICVGPDDDTYSFEIVFGKDKGSKFLGCNRKFKFLFDCVEPIELDTAVSCCDNLAVHSEFQHIPGFCCTKIFLDSFKTKECIYSIDIDRKGNGVMSNLAFSDNPLDLDSMLQSPIETLCESSKSCDSGTISNPIIYNTLRTIYFRGKDREVLCSKEIIVYSCCDNFYDYSGGDPGEDPDDPYKKAIESDLVHDISLKLIPNPSNGKSKLGIDTENETLGTIKVVNILGEVLITLPSGKLNSGYNEIDLNLSNIRSGMYMIILETPLGTASTNIIKFE